MLWRTNLIAWLVSRGCCLNSTDGRKVNKTTRLLYVLHSLTIISVFVSIRIRSMTQLSVYIRNLHSAKSTWYEHKRTSGMIPWKNRKHWTTSSLCGTLSHTTLLATDPVLSPKRLPHLFQKFYTSTTRNNVLESDSFDREAEMELPMSTWGVHFNYWFA